MFDLFNKKKPEEATASSNPPAEEMVAAFQGTDEIPEGSKPEEVQSEFKNFISNLKPETFTAADWFRYCMDLLHINKKLSRRINILVKNLNRVYDRLDLQTDKDIINQAANDFRFEVEEALEKNQYIPKGMPTVTQEVLKLESIRRALTKYYDTISVTMRDDSDKEQKQGD